VSDLTVELEVPARAMAVGAHPDDIEFGCGGTLAKWAAAGCEIFHVVCTDGSKGSWDPTEDTAALVTTRQQEQRAASLALGGKGEVAFLEYVDGELESGLEPRAALAYWIRKFKPDVLFGHDPWKRYRLHPDHRHAGFIVTDGIVAARDPHFFPDQLDPEQGVTPHRPSTLLLWEADTPDHVEDVSAFVEPKLAALLAHRSQFRSTMAIDDPDAVDEVQSFRDRMLARLAELGAPAGIERGEAFKRIDRL
jgi:LmbE family N-acetylglucosaminyl deacetylase